MEAVRLSLEDPVDIREEDGRIVIEPIHKNKYDLAQMLAAITLENLHAEAVFGTPVGKELL
jgi:antitoxin MazE